MLLFTVMILCVYGSICVRGTLQAEQLAQADDSLTFAYVSNSSFEELLRNLGQSEVRTVPYFGSRS